jgi:hypothetical protein
MSWFLIPVIMAHILYRMCDQHSSNRQILWEEMEGVWTVTVYAACGKEREGTSYWANSGRGRRRLYTGGKRSVVFCRLRTLQGQSQWHQHWYTNICANACVEDVLGGADVQIHPFLTSLLSGGCGLEVVCWPLVPKFAGLHPAEAVEILWRKKFSARLPSEGK